MMKYARMMVAAAVVLCSLCATAQTKRGDVTGDGNVDIADVNYVIDLMLGKVTSETIYTVNGVTFSMVDVQGGTFTMGATPEMGDHAWHPNDKPAHEVTLSSFSIGATEVTQELWVAVMGTNPSYYNGTGGGRHIEDYGVDLKRPVENVSWNLCQTFIEKLNELTGQHFRLPTEAEWEFAARGGNKTQGYRYAGSNTVDDVAWYGANSDGMTHAVAGKKPNELGLYDMSGNVIEWCQDWYGDYSAEAQTNPAGPESGEFRVMRGSHINDTEQIMFISRRSGFYPSVAVAQFGLRLAQ